MNIDNRLISSFLAIVETGSLTAAARLVHRSQSAISQQVAKLEADLGKKLLHRGKVLTLTSEGETFLQYARKVHSLSCELEDTLLRPELEGQVRFGLPEDFASFMLSDILGKFTKLHPKIRFSVDCDLTMNLVNRLDRGEVDVILIKLTQSILTQNLVSIWSEPLDWVCPEGAAEEILSHEHLKLVLSPEPCVYHKRAIEALENHGCSWRLNFTSPSYTCTIAAVQAGFGITVLPRSMIPAGLQSIYSSKLPNLKDVHVSLLKQNDCPPAVDSLEQFIKQRVQKAQRNRPTQS